MGNLAVAEDVQFRQMIDSITEYAVIRLEVDGAVASWHTGAERLTGYAAEEILGRPVSTFGAAQDVSPIEEHGLATAGQEGRFEAEGWRVRKDGRRFWASECLTPIRSPAGELLGYVLVVRDLTERRLAEQALQAMEKMLDSITDYEVIQLDADGVVRSWNPGAQRLKQYTRDEALGRHVSMFYTEDDAHDGLAEQEMAAAARVGRFESEGWRVRKDGSVFWSSIILSPIRDTVGELIGFVKVARDLTERREQDQLLARQRDEILELSTPVIQVWDKVLVLPIIGTLDSVRASRLTEGLLQRIAEHQAEVIILDVSGVPAIDTTVAQHLLKTVQAARLMGSVSILSGVRPETAQSIVHLGIDLGGMHSRNTLRDALQLALRLLGAVADGGLVSAAG
jgi:PAS domain S-box-containing protein